MPSKEILRRSRVCIVPVCKAVNSDFPDRIFFAVPENKKKNWLEIVGCDSSSIKTNKRLYCCENHFDVMKYVCCFFYMFQCEFSFQLQGAKRYRRLPFL